MIKNLIIRLITFLTGIDIRRLLSSNQVLQSNLNSLEQKNAELNQQIVAFTNQLLQNENIRIVQSEEIAGLVSERKSIQLNTKQLAATIQTQKLKDDKNQQLIKRLTTEKDNEVTVLNNIIDNHKSEIIDLKLNTEKLVATTQTQKLKDDENQQLAQNLKTEIEHLREKLKTEIEKVLSKQTQLKELETRSSEGKNTINNLQELLKNQNRNESSQLEMIRSLKELVSQLQSVVVNYKIKDEEIQNLRKNIDNGNEKIHNLESDLVVLQNELAQSKNNEIDHSEQPFPKRLHKVDGIVIIHHGLNLGKRLEKSFENVDNKFDYIGEFTSNLWKFSQNDSMFFPDVFYPKLNTKILKWQIAKSNTTTGVAEPLFVDAIKALNTHVPEIEILQNICLSIRNRDYSYIPDLALVWLNYNLCIDIEIDEPYDLVTRKPIHYIGSTDYLRNLYFISQGWVVIRFSEEQVVTNISNCIKYVAHVLKTITRCSFFDDLLENFEPDFINRWTYDEAIEYAENNFREDYLHIESVDQIIELDSTVFDDSPFNSIPPSDDILPEVDYSILEKKLMENQKRYLRITRNPLEDQKILDNYSCEKQLYRQGILGFDMVEEESIFVPFEAMIDIEGMDSPFKYLLYNNPGRGSDEKIYDYVKEAIYGCNPLRIQYSDAQANITFRNVAMISYVPDSQLYLGDNNWENYYYNGKRSMITAFCMLRHAQRNFYVNRIQAIQVFDTKHLGFGHIISFDTALWYPLNNNDFQLCDHISKLIPTYLKETSLTLAGNFAHFLLLTGKKEDALQIYKKFDGQMVTKDIGWREMNLKDFQDLQSIADYKEKFDEATELLGWNK